MADTKISALTDGTPAQQTDQIPINRGGVNFRVNASSLNPGPSVVQSGLMAQYRILPTEAPAALVDYSGNGNNATGTAGTAPTIIPSTGGVNFVGTGAVQLPAALNAALTIQLFASVSNFSGSPQALVSGNNGGSGTSGAAFFGVWNSNGGVTQPPIESALRLVSGYSVLPQTLAYNWSRFLLPANPKFVSLVMDTVDTIYVGPNSFNASNGLFRSSAGLQVTGNYQLGGSATGLPSSVYMTGAIYYALFYNRVLTAAEVTQNYNAVIAEMAWRGVNLTGFSTRIVKDIFVADGDSITAGVGLTIAYPSIITLNGLAYAINNVAVTGFTMANIQVWAKDQVDPCYSPLAGRNTCVVWAGTNDGGVSIEGSLRRYCQDRRAVGWNVFVITMLSRTGSDTFKNAYNIWIRQNWREFADGLIDIAADINMGADGASVNTTYFQSGVHPTQAAAYNIVAPAIQRAINRFYGNNDFANATTYAAGAPAPTAITAASQSGNTMTFTTTLNPPVGSMATVTGVTPAGYNGIWRVLTSSGTQFTAYNYVTGLGAGTVFGTAAIPLQVDADGAVILGGSGAGNNYTLESSVGYSGQRIRFRNTNGNSWTLTPSGTETINGAASLTVAPGTSVTLEAQLVSPTAAGSNWIVV